MYIRAMTVGIEIDEKYLHGVPCLLSQIRSCPLTKAGASRRLQRVVCARRRTLHVFVLISARRR